MSAPSSDQCADIRATLIDELIMIRKSVKGPDGGDPALGRPTSLEDDAVEMCAAVYALPVQFRELGKSGIPLMWAWPWDLYGKGLDRRDELMLAAALLLSSVERLDRGQIQDVRHLQAVTTSDIGQK